MLSGFKPLAITHTSAGAPITPITQVMSSTSESRLATWSIMRLVAASPSVCLLAASTGTKAWLNAPSANRRRSKFGMRKATLKASVSAPAPKAEAMSCSRTRPVMRDTSVSNEMVEAALNKFTERECRT